VTQRRDHVRHRQHKNGRVSAVPIKRRVMSFSSASSSGAGGDVFPFERHAANRATAGMILLDLQCIGRVDIPSSGFHVGFRSKPSRTSG
jgi:hypothetical protein